MYHAIRSLLIVAFAALAVACNPIERASDARERVDVFHQRMNGGDDDAIWRDLAPEFREASTRQQFDNLLGTVRRTLGKMEETSQAGVNMNTNPGGSFTVLTMRTRFEQGEGQEIFTFIDKDGTLKLAGYTVNSQAMMDRLMAQGAAGEGGADKVAPATSPVPTQTFRPED